MKILKNKKLLIGIIALLVIAIVSSVIIINKDKEPKTKIEQPKVNEKENTTISTLNKVEPLEKSDAASSSELIKKNIVKITNEVEGTTVTGTGFFHESGYLITNSHVVDLKGKINITYSDGTKTTATLVANDMTSDIAILSVKNPNALALTLSNTLTLKVTDELYAIGYPFALEGEATTTKGILSARRSAGGIEYLQTDMSLNTGNSGGPLINDKAEVFGMTTYATENASLGMSISAESLEATIKKILENKEIKYLEDDRKTNALSTVLTEIGHKDDDIYDEKERLDKVFNRKSEKEEKPEAKPVVKKSGDTTLKSLTINGKSFGVDKENDFPVYYRVRRQSLDPLKIVAVPTHPKATVKISGNRAVEAGKTNIVNITVTAENGKEWIYDIKVRTTKPTLDRLAKVEVYGYKEYDSNIKEAVIRFEISPKDKDGLDVLDQEYDCEPFTKLTITLYTEVHNAEGMQRRKLNTYTLNYGDGKDYIKLSEIKKLLIDSDFYFGETKQDFAFSYLEAKVETVSQGTFIYSGAGPELNR